MPTYPDCPCCGFTPPSCVDVSPPPSDTLHLVFTLHRPDAAGGDITAERDAVWVPASMSGNGGKWQWEGITAPDEDGNQFADPLKLCTPDDGPSGFWIYGVTIRPDYCGDGETPMIKVGGGVIVGHVTAGEFLPDDPRIGGGDDTGTVISTSPLTVSATFDGGCLGCPNDPDINPDGWPVSVTATDGA